MQDSHEKLYAHPHRGMSTAERCHGVMRGSKYCTKGTPFTQLADVAKRAAYQIQLHTTAPLFFEHLSSFLRTAGPHAGFHIDSRLSGFLEWSGSSTNVTRLVGWLKHCLSPSHSACTAQYKHSTAQQKWASTLAGWPRRTTLIFLSTSPSTMLSTAALVSAQARIGVKGWRGLVFTITSMKANRVRVLPVPGGPCI